LITESGDGREVGANNATLVLDGAAGALLGGLLGKTLLVSTSEESCPGNATGVLALAEKRLRLPVRELEPLGVAPDVETSLGRIDSVAAEWIVHELHLEDVFW